MSQTYSPSDGRRYRLQRVCHVWKMPRSTVHEQCERNAIPAELQVGPGKRRPKGPYTDAQLVEQIQLVLNEGPFHGEGNRKAWARLCGMLHRHFEGAPVVGRHVLNYRGALSSPVGIQGAFSTITDRTPGLSKPCPGAKRRLHYRGGRGMIVYKPVSKKT